VHGDFGGYLRDRQRFKSVICHKGRWRDGARTAPGWRSCPDVSSMLAVRKRRGIMGLMGRDSFGGVEDIGRNGIHSGANTRG